MVRHPKTPIDSMQNKACPRVENDGESTEELYLPSDADLRHVVPSAGVRDVVTGTSILVRDTDLQRMIDRQHWLRPFLAMALCAGVMYGFNRERVSVCLGAIDADVWLDLNELQKTNSFLVSARGATAELGRAVDAGGSMWSGESRAQAQTAVREWESVRLNAGLRRPVCP